MKLPVLSITILFLVFLLLIGCTKEKKETAKIDNTEPALPSLQAKLDEKKAGFEKRAPEEIKKDFAEGQDSVAMSGVLETALNVGDTAPDFILPNANGKQVQLSVLLQKGPVILSWYRGGW